jgi:hypothetical protein
MAMVDSTAETSTVDAPPADDRHKAMLEDCFLHTASFAKVFMPETFKRPFYDDHRTVFDAFDDDDCQLFIYIAPRGFGKTALLRSKAAQISCYSQMHWSKYGIWISNTEDVAADDLEGVKGVLENSHAINSIFPPDNKGTMKTKQWGKKQFTTSTGFRWRARGAGQQIRGTTWGRHRPGWILINDLESRKGVRSEDQRRELKEWFFTDILGSRDKDIKSRVIITATNLHEDSLAMNLHRDPNVRSVLIELCDENFTPRWKHWYTREQILALYEMYDSQGQSDQFFQEYRNIAINPKDSTFPDRFLHYSELELQEKIKAGGVGLENVVLVDPSKDVKAHSCFTAIVVVGFDAINHKLYVRETLNERLTPDKIVSIPFDVADKFGTNLIGVEVQGLNAWVEWPFQQEAAKHSKAYRIVPLKPGNNRKEERIKWLVPFYRNGIILHNDSPAIYAPLEAQLKGFPNSQYLDLADCLAYLIQMFDLGERYFQPPVPVKEEDDYEDEEKELARLRLVDKMDDIGDDWCLFNYGGKGHARQTSA